MQLEFFSALDTGRARSNNEDAVRIDERLALAVLADGMGGYNAGEVASAMTVDSVCEDIARWLAEDRGPRDEEEIRQALMASAQRANRAVFDASQSRAEYAGMGTTLVAALFNDDRVWVGHVGDSRAYRLRGGRLEQLSRDHSLLQEQIDAGLLTPEEAVYSMNRNLVTRAVGVEPDVELEVVGHDLRSGDVVLLCSDGLSDMLPDATIAQVMRASDSLELTAQALIAAANAAGGRDNISVVLVRAKGGAAQAGRAWWPFRRA
ncbi:Stp1/IreP family PP2C-type Ser/Thr phosphatase [Ideonella sp.]|uniref:Stp1/IreP family PP2C-type Ser/Thr phosphatase n=1 Tax=Ideonella sp. TaxID=1929293 RepID=UPI002B45935D|nr:Stp1/IreP family PP2C-type Ser/Thr phosphatase [Ideonella sp.]HJV68890.1 Stp1/IreP family PP2C-type Ser/Thr phosphatase [Ideonella sp.]